MSDFGKVEKFKKTIITRNRYTERVSSSVHPEKIFLSAEWRDLVLLNYVVEPSLLRPFIPKGTMLGSFQGKAYISLVGFRFCKTKLRGRFAVPFHSEFEEVNLRFYVHREAEGELRRGVVFIKEIVPKSAIALTARMVYGENYVSLPMKHSVSCERDATEAEYCWKHEGGWSKLFARSSGTAALSAQNSLEQYITEHYWGYSRQKSGSTIEYHVTHVSWKVRHATDAGFLGNATKLYGAELGGVLSRPPDSAYIADGSFVEVHRGVSLQ